MAPEQEDCTADGVPLDNELIPIGCLVLPTSVSLWQNREFWRNRTEFFETNFTEEDLIPIINRLLKFGLICVATKACFEHVAWTVCRIYVRASHPDGGAYASSRGSKLRLDLARLLDAVSTNRKLWKGKFTCVRKRKKFDLAASSEFKSLFYIYNTLPSPSPSVTQGLNTYVREALEDLLSPDSAPVGLRSTLYPYQRRAAGLMLQRESSTRLELDPRLERRVAPDGTLFYYGARDGEFLMQPRLLEACRGGILAESMGLGKTVMILALILSTKHHPAHIPSKHLKMITRPRVGSLSSMVVTSIIKSSIPWKVEFDRLRHATGCDAHSCSELLNSVRAEYTINQTPLRRFRDDRQSDKVMLLSSTTLLVVPPNLFRQWVSEISKHVQLDALRVLAVESLATSLPQAAEIVKYDIVLLTKSRLEAEDKDGTDSQGRRENQRECQCMYIGATRIRDCHCVRTEHLHDSPLKYIHFKRLVVDEGHSFSNADSRAVHVSTSLVTADHRWIVSGTPAQDLVGSEVELSLHDRTSGTSDATESDVNCATHSRQEFTKADTTGAIKSIGKLVSTFLQIDPWAAKGTSRAEWDEYVYRHEQQKRTYTCFSSALRRTLESVIIRTQPSDVEKDLQLPPLYHDIVRLAPSFYDKLTANCFALVLTANAVTSERSDIDYLFHKKSVKARKQLISNLRQSAFFWTGFTEADITGSIDNCDKYMSKHGKYCSKEDAELLSLLRVAAKLMMRVQGWSALSRTHEMGLFVKDWPDDAASCWSFDRKTEYTMTGISQLSSAQSFVNERSDLADPGEGLAGEGVRQLRVATPRSNGSQRNEEQVTEVKAGVPISSTKDQPVLRRKVDPKTTRMKRRLSEIDSLPDLPLRSIYRQAQIVGSTSSKLSYLVSRISALHQHEKILVFYEGDNIAYYIAQALDLLDISYEIYAKSLKSDQKSKYIVRFEDDTSGVRVLLMDVNQAAHGLNVPSASRIFFVNPVCRPNIEAQAIKRAHRIGQTKPVYVETLVLEDSVEEKMLERSRRMTHAEHSDAKTLEDDGGIKKIIQDIRPMYIHDQEYELENQMAPLMTPEQLWGRPSWRRSRRQQADTTSRKRAKVRAAEKDSILLEAGSGLTANPVENGANVIGTSATAASENLDPRTDFSHNPIPTNSIATQAVHIDHGSTHQMKRVAFVPV